MVHDRLRVELAELGERAALAEQTRVEEVGGVAPGLEREVRLPLALSGEVGELEDLLGERQLDELPLVRQQHRRRRRRLRRRRRCCRGFAGRGTVPGLAPRLLGPKRAVGFGEGD